jgi:hypothetical protein
LPGNDIVTAIGSRGGSDPASGSLLPNTFSPD